MDSASSENEGTGSATANMDTNKLVLEHRDKLRDGATYLIKLTKELALGCSANNIVVEYESKVTSEKNKKDINNPLANEELIGTESVIIKAF